jgi:hypothetical protein
MSNHKSQDRGDRGVSEVVGEDILPHVIKFVESEYFESRVQQYLEKHEQVFADEMEVSGKASTDDGGSLDFEELKVEYMTVFHGYQSLIEELLDEYAQESDLSAGEIFAACRDAADDKFTALFDEHEHKWFVELLMSWMNFDDFMKKVHKTKGRSSRNSRK